MLNDLSGNEVLLSVIIPTKNRQHTCIYAVASVLELNKNDVEIIVQDCSDTNVLQQQLLDKFGVDSRIKYEYLDTKPSMTDNWNRGFERAIGQYQCGIGDDDAVLPNIYEEAKNAKEKNIDALGHSKKYGYFWDDYTVIPEYASNLVLYVSNAPAIKIYNRSELDELLMKQATFPDMNYRKLPMAYHCLLSKSIIDQLIKKTGKFLDGTSLDVYSAFALGLEVTKYYVLDKPFTLPGACGSSNSNKSLKKNFSDHFSEFKKIDIDKRIPQHYNLTFTIAESTQVALKKLDDKKFSGYLDLPGLYGQFFSDSFSVPMFRLLLAKMKENNFNKKQYVAFAKQSFKKIASTKTNEVKNLIKRIPFVKKWTDQKYANSILLYKCDTISEAVKLIVHQVG